MNKSDLIELIAQKASVPQKEAFEVVNIIFDSMTEALVGGERIEIRGFGSFYAKHYKSYQGRNPKTGTEIHVKEKRLPFFKVGKELKERLNITGDDTEEPEDTED